jgi:hypothetical protein
MKQNHSTQSSGRVTRRQFIKLAAATGLLAGCTAVEQPVAAPTSAPAATPVPAATATPVPAAATTPVPTEVPKPTSVPTVVSATTGPPDIIKFYPDVPSKVVHTHHAGVWNGDQLSSEAIREMLDASITKLTGLNDAGEAWAALFKPTEKIAIKINAFSNSTIWTHAPLVNAVVVSLQEAGLPAGQIFIYDHLSMLKEAGYEVNKDGPGVRCFEETDFTGDWKVASSTVHLSSTLQNCDALINIPVLKSHMIAGLTFALKNHFGTVSFPDSLHYPIDQSIAELNALSPIKDRTRLVIGDILEANLKYSGGWPYWKPDWKGDSILMSFDSVAHDTIGMQILDRLQTENDKVLSSALRDKATSYLKVATELGLGTNDPQNMEVEEVKLG